MKLSLATRCLAALSSCAFVQTMWIPEYIKGPSDHSLLRGGESSDAVTTGNEDEDEDPSLLVPSEAPSFTSDFPTATDAPFSTEYPTKPYMDDEYTSVPTYSPTVEKSSGSENIVTRNINSHEDQPVRDFVPLSCNEQMSHCQPWTSYFGSENVFEQQVTVPCGVCITVDVEGSLLEFHQGLEVQGKLSFPDHRETPLTVRTPHIFVQGELEVLATHQRVNGEFVYRFVLLDAEDGLELSPVDSNQNACQGENCNVGTKVIAVAGGKLTVNGIPAHTTTWVRLHDTLSDLQDDEDAVTTLVVSKAGVRNKWEAGAEILVTSHTTNWSDGHQVARIAKVLNYDNNPALVKIKLVEPLRYLPTTEQESVDFAVEVALLSRNIVFEGELNAKYPHIGGQLVVFHTPDVSQQLQGVEIKNFGQQGYLGRYPIHFHFCGHVPTATVAQNTIRESNQRCVVVHGTHDLQIHENVAYDTAGHCFMLEDGYEVGNSFVRNLGAKTRPPVRVIPNKGPNGDETDGMPSTFWITNPTNNFIGNVAAGAADAGFWFEPKLRGERASWYPDLEPRSEPIGIFEDNVAHSNGHIGFRFYPSGYRPDQVGLLQNLKAYRNVKGLFLHLSANMDIVGGLYADNRDNLEIDRSDNIDVTNVTIIGVSESYHKLRARQQVPAVCRQGSVVGLEHHTWKNNPRLVGSSIKNVTFLGFLDTGCSEAHAIRVDNRIQTPLFDMYTTFEDIHFEAGAERMFFCDAIDVEVDAYYTDLDGSLDHVVNRNRRKAGTIMSNTDTMKQFVDEAQCYEYESACAMYCRSTCFRTVQYHVNPAGTENWKLHVCSVHDGSNCVDFSGYYRGRDPTSSSRHRTFNAYLPTGKYTAVFLDESGNEAWPAFVETVYQQDKLCPTALEEGDVELIVPTIDVPVTCSELLLNRGFDEETNHVPDFWLQRFGGITAANGVGIDGSVAVSSRKAAPSNMLVQFIDNRCMIKGLVYEFRAWVKLYDSRGNEYECNADNERCPEVGLETVNGRRSYAFMTGEVKNGFALVQGTLELTEDFVAELRREAPVSLIIRSNVDLYWLVDNVSMRAIQSP